jgi:hypothetical protein
MKIKAVRQNPFFAPLAGALAAGVTFILVLLGLGRLGPVLLRDVQSFDAFGLWIVFTLASSVISAFIVAFVTSSKLK